jgi:enoyl-CoA hydratase/carnithine racemase
MMCDLRIVAEDAKVGLPFVRRGVIGEANSHWVLPRLVGSAVAAELLLTGRLISGAEAAAIGLCSRAVPAGQVLDVARSLAAEIAVDTAPMSVAVSKRLLWEALEASRGDAGVRESQLFHWLARQADAAEGVASFLERRPPRWSLPPSTPLPPPEAPG